MAQNPFNDLLGFDPFVEINAYRAALRQLVESGLPMPRDLMPAGLAAVIIPVDMLDTGPDILIQTNLPGVNPDKVTITVTGNNLTIKGSITPLQEFQGATYLRRERRAASFVRTISLPVAVEAEQAVARFDNGVLTLTLPKSEAVRPKTIKVVRES